MRTTDKPFAEALQELMEERGWSMRQQLDPSPEAIEKIAAVFRVPPDYFAEYRLAKARDSLDPGVVGLEKALRNLKQQKGR